jgi:hypothetical protein
MNKKLKIAVFLVVVVILIPFGYKQYISSRVLKQITSLNQKGFLVTLKSDESSFLTTRQTYKAIVSNPQKIYQEFFSQLFGYVKSPVKDKIFSSLNGSELTIKINILNFPVTHENAINIYLTSLPAKAQNLQKKDLLLQEISTFLANFGFGESIDINALGKPTKIKFKDIDQQFDAKKGTLTLNLKEYISNIKRFDLKNNSYDFTTYNKAFGFSMQTKDHRGFELATKNLKCNVDKNDAYNYTMLCNLENLNFSSKTYRQNDLLLKNFFISTTSKSQNNMINYSFKYKIKDIKLQTKSLYTNGAFILKGFKYYGSLGGVDKQLLEQFQLILSKSTNLKRDKEFKKTVLKLLSAGFTFDISKLSADSLVISSGKKDIKIGDIDISLKLTMSKNDISSRKRPKITDLLKYITVDSKIVMLKKDFELLQSIDKRKKLSKILKFAKIKGDKIIFEITFKNSMLSINKKRIL